MIGLVDGNNFFVSCERVVDPKLVGRAVAVLSNNDGCCVSRSTEFKCLGIPMGTPYFQLKDRERTGEIVFRSSNYELYADISSRIISILRDNAVDVEQYSIDEAFIHPPSTADIATYGRTLRAKILQWTGIPCGIGFAPSKTLAKIANHIGKKTSDGVFILPDNPTEILAELPVEEVWGVGRRLATSLHGHGVHTADQFRKLADDEIRSIGSVTLLRTAMELRGTPCIDDRDYDADPNSISCSRSFGSYVTTADELAETIASFTTTAAQKLRRHSLVASGANIYAQHGTACENGWFSRTVTFPHPTDATNEMLNAIHKEVGALFRPGLKYRKSGMLFFGLERLDAPQQLDLFATTEAVPVKDSRGHRLFKAVDAINAKFGAGKVFSASEGIASKRKWKNKRSKLSPRATTNWDELIVVR